MDEQEWIEQMANKYIELFKDELACKGVDDHVIVNILEEMHRLGEEVFLKYKTMKKIELLKD